MDSFMTRVCKQTAVYWGSPTQDGYGGLTFDDPIEIDCRWEDVVQTVTMLGASRQSVEIVSKAQIFVLEDLDEQGWLYLGNLIDLDNDERADPKLVDGAYEIKRFDKTPSMKANEFVRKVYV